MANRQTRRKQKNFDNKKIIPQVEEEGVPSIIRVGIIVIVLIAAFYGITVLLTKNMKANDQTSNNDDNTNTPVAVQYKEILAGETFNMNAPEYFVVFYDFDDESASIYETIINDYKTANTTAKVYIVDLSKGFSTPYIGEVSNPSVQRIEDLKVKGLTLIKINNGVNVAYAEGIDAVHNILK